MMFPYTLKLGSEQIPYMRSKLFSEVLLKLEAALLGLVSAPVGSRVVFLTGSGTGAMEAAILNFVDTRDFAAVINGGTFGQRFAEILARHNRIVHEVKVDRDTLRDGRALARIPDAVTALLINVHETSIGHLYNLDATAQFCQNRDCLHIVDAIGLFATDPLNMSKSKIDVLIVSSNKGLAVVPGISMIVMSPTALSRIIAHPRTYYFDINAMLLDGLRGQTPFTPAIGVLCQLSQRLDVLTDAGIDVSIARAAKLAAHFRANISHLPLRFYSQSMPNAMTAIEVFDTNLSARSIVNLLDVKYDLVVAPNAGSIGESVFRVAHMGNLSTGDVDRLVTALTEILDQHPTEIAQ